MERQRMAGRTRATIVRTSGAARASNGASASEGNRAEAVYSRVKDDIFEFRLAPGARFSENELAGALGVSRTPIREALFRLSQEGYIDVAAKSGWTVRPFDFEAFEHLYEVRAILEVAAVRRLCECDPLADLSELRETWLVPAAARVSDGRRLSALDEAFHRALVAAAGNPELARTHQGVTERIRIVRRLELQNQARHDDTYAEHAQILRAILRRRVDQAVLLLKAHIDGARRAVRGITLHRLAALNRGQTPIVSIR
jgi:DNA-binding GntR family transcriptional regulator